MFDGRHILYKCYTQIALTMCTIPVGFYHFCGIKKRKKLTVNWECKCVCVWRRPSIVMQKFKSRQNYTSLLRLAKTYSHIITPMQTLQSFIYLFI